MTLDQLRSKPHISVNQLKTFMACPRKYALQYVERAEPSFRHISLVLGTAVHHAFGDLLVAWQGGSTIPSSDLGEVFVRAYRQQLEEGLPVLVDDEGDEARLEKTGRAMVEMLLREFPSPSEVIGVEVPFSLDLFDPKTGEVLEVPLVGAMDAVVCRGGRTTIVELKTAARRWAELDVLYDFQPTAYFWAWRDNKRDLPDVELVVATKSERPQLQREQLIRTQEDIDELAAVSASVLRGIAAGVDHPVRSWRCKTCPYQNDCR